MKEWVPRLLLLALLMAVAVGTGYAQGGGSSTSLTGTVSDQTGAIIPGAEVEAKNNATGAEGKAVTSENGTFSIPFLSPGTYSATVTMPNFKQAIVKDIVLVAGTPSAIRVVLEVGGTSETVTARISPTVPSKDNSPSRNANARPCRANDRSSPHAAGWCHGTGSSTPSGGRRRSSGYHPCRGRCATQGRA